MNIYPREEPLLSLDLFDDVDDTVEELKLTDDETPVSDEASVHESVTGENEE